MLILLKNHLTDKTQLFNVNSIVTSEILKAISKWIEDNLSTFNLNEPHSCIVRYTNKNEIHITGDEDIVRFSVSLAEDNAINLKC
jgi:hypothetical protein